MKVRIVTDSASDLPRDIHPQVTVMPLNVMFGEEQFLDGVNISHSEFIERLVSSNELPHTSQINPDEYETVFRKAVEAGEDVVVVVLSSKLSGTCQSAMIAAQDFEGHVWVVDSENAALGEGIIVSRAIQLMESGLSAPEIADRLNSEKKDVRLFALLDTLEYLKRGGRLSAGAAFIGGLLSIKPVITVRDGEVAVLGKARGTHNGNNLLTHEIETTNGIDFGRPYMLAYSGLTDSTLQKYIEDSSAIWAEHSDSLPISTIGCTIGTHVGPGAIGVAFFEKEG